jgi:hypothetical protein
MLLRLVPTPVSSAAVPCCALLLCPAAAACCCQADAAQLESQARSLSGPDGLVPDASGNELQQALAAVAASTESGKFAYNRFFAVGLFRCAVLLSVWLRCHMGMWPADSCGQHSLSVPDAAACSWS